MTNNKIKVLHVVLSMETGGLENGIVNLINHSTQEDYIVDVLCLREKGELADRVTNPLSRVYFDGNTDHSLLTSIKKIISICKSENYDIVHSHGFTTMLASYLAKKVCHFPILINGEHGTLYFDSLRKRLLQTFLFSRVNLNLTVSAELKTKILSLFNISKDNFKPIINGVDTSRFKRNINERITFRNKLGIKDNQIIIGSVGRLVSGKDYKSLIKAFSRIAPNIKNTHLIIAGDGPEYATLSSLICQLGLDSRIHLLGRRDDIPALLNAYDLFVLPSKSEGLSNTLLEAMSSGLPAIACDVGGNPEIVIPQVSGFLYEQGNEIQLSQILTSMCENQAAIDELSISARDHILKHHSLVSMVNNYESTYQDLVRHKSLLKQPIEA